MSNSNLPPAHDSSLDDARLVRRCQRRVMMFPHYKHDFSANTTQSSALPSSSLSLLDGSGEGPLSADSFQSSTLTSTDKHDPTVIANTSLNRNPYQDGRRWVGNGDWCYPPHHTSLQPGPGAEPGGRSCPVHSLMTETGHRQCCLATSDNDGVKGNEVTDNPSNTSLDSLPIIDNLILEPHCDLKNASGLKAKQSRSAHRCTQHDPHRAIIYAWRESGPRGSENKKHKQQKTAGSRQSASVRSCPAGKAPIDPDSDTYLHRLDNVLEKMCISDKNNPRLGERMSRNSKDAACSSVSKVPAKKLCTCWHKSGAGIKMSMHDVINDMKRVGQFKPKTGTKVDITRQEKTANAAKSTTRTRCPQKIDKKQMLESQDNSTSTCKEQTRQCSLPTNSSQRSSGAQANVRIRSRSLPALPRCHVHTLTSTSCPHRAHVRLHSCGATASCCTYTTSSGTKKITKQQQEILKHIPNDITPDEIGALMKTVLSIVERRHSLRGSLSGGRSQTALQDLTDTGREDLSKYHVRGPTDSCNTQITLSSKPKIDYSCKPVDGMSSHDLLQTTISSQSSRDEADVPSRDVDTGLDTKSMYFEIPKVNCLNSASGQVSCSLPGDTKEDVRTSSLALNSLRYGDSTSSGSEYSSRTYHLAMEPAGRTVGSNKAQTSKQAAVVLPFDDSNLPRQKRPAQPGGEETRGDQQLAPATNPAADSLPETKQNLCTFNADDAVSSRHIGWKSPLQTERINSLTPTDCRLGGANILLPKAGQNRILRSDSALSDGLLYVKSNTVSRTWPYHRLPRRNCASHVVLAANRCPHHGHLSDQPDSRKSSSSSLINEADLGVDDRSAPAPCPYEYNHSGCSHGDVLTHPRQCTYLRDTEVDRKIADLKLQIQRSYRMPWRFAQQKSTPVRPGMMTTTTTNALGRQSTFLRAGTPDEGKCPGETTDLDTRSCSLDTEVTNTSISNRLQELDGEMSTSPELRRPCNASVVPTGNTSQFTSLPGQYGLHIRHEFSAYRGGAASHRLDAATPSGELTTDRLNQSSWASGHRESRFRDDYNWRQSKTTTETCRETGNIFSDQAPRRLSNVSISSRDLDTIYLTRQDLPTETGRPLSYETEKVRSQADNVFCVNERAIHQACGATSAGCEMQTSTSLEARGGVDAIRKCSRANSMQLPGCRTQCSSFETSNTLELAVSVEPPENLKRTYSLDERRMLNPTNGLDQRPHNLKPYRKLGVADMMSVGAKVEQSVSSHPYAGFKPTNMTDTASNIRPLDVSNVYTSVSSHINKNLVTNPNTPNNFELVASPTDKDVITNPGTRNNEQIASKPSRPPSTLQSGQQSQVDEASSGKGSHSPKVNSTAVRSSFKKTNLAQLKQRTESLLVEVCRRYSTDTLVPGPGTSNSSDFMGALQFLQNFSPISQVDVNTKYPISMKAKDPLMSAETKNNENNSTGQSQQVTSEVMATRNASNQLSAVSPRDKTTISVNRVQKSLVKTNCRQAKKLSKAAGSCSRSAKIVVKDKDVCAIQRPNHNNTETGLHEATATKPQLRYNIKQSVHESTTTVRKHGKSKAVKRRGDAVVVDVTSPHTSDQSSNEGGDNPKKQVNPHSIILKKYSATSAMPVEVKDISCSLSDSSDAHMNSAQKHSPQKPSLTFEDYNTACNSSKTYETDAAHPRNTNRSCQQVDSCQSCTIERLVSAAAEARRMLSSRVKQSERLFSGPDCSLTSDSFLDTTTDSDVSLHPITIDEADVGSHEDVNTNCNNSSWHIPVSSGACLVRLSTATSLFSIMFQVHNCVCRQTCLPGIMQLIAHRCHLVQVIAHRRHLVQLIAHPCHFVQLIAHRRHLVQLIARRRHLMQLIALRHHLVQLIAHRRHLVQLIAHRRHLVQLIALRRHLVQLIALRRHLVQLIANTRLHGALWTSVADCADDNESAAASRPCSKILGELAFQLERRMLDYVFGMEGSNRRRFYGYTVNNICQMMNKESKNMCGGDDPLRKSELAFRLKKLLVGLKRVGYNIKVHGDFAQQMVNTYGLLPCAPDPATIHDFGLHNANCIAGLINHLASDPAERDNLLILLNSLKYLSKCDSRPLFVW